MTTLIAGAGLAGLTAAAHLRRCGCAFEIWDPSSPGGRARSQREAGGWLNFGPHALPRYGHAVAELAKLGVPWSGAQPRRGLFMTRGDERHPIPLNPLTLFTSSAFSFASRWTIGRTLAILDGRSGQSVETWLETIADLPARQLVRSLMRVATYGGDPTTMDAEAACGQMRTVLRGVVYVDGGWQSLVDGLVACCGPVAPRALRALRSEAGAWIASDGRVEHRFDSVVLAMPPDRVRRLLGAEAIPQTQSVRMAALDLVLESLPNPDVRFSMALDAPLYFSVHSGVARLADHDRQVVHAARYLSGSEDDSLARIEAYLDRLQPGWRARVLHRRFLPRIPVHHGFHPVDGKRPAVVLGAGLFLAGDWIGEEGMLADAAMASGARAADAAMHYDAADHRAMHALA